jgi:hypothetical protein
MPTIELWLFTVTDPQTGKRRRTTYRLTIEEARARYLDPEPVPNSLERREVGMRHPVTATCSGLASVPDGIPPSARWKG